MYGSSKDSSCIDYVKGANVGGFLKVAQSNLLRNIKRDFSGHLSVSASNSGNYLTGIISCS